MAENLVYENGNKVVTSSITVSELFKKRHDHVLRDIDLLKEDVPSFGEMFFESTEPDGYGRDRKVYYMNKDGFSLLAMGFTGKKALKFKLQYIEAFNKMENQLKIISKQGAQVESSRTTESLLDYIDLLKGKITELESTNKLAVQALPQISEFEQLFKERGKILPSNIATKLGYRNTVWAARQINLRLESLGVIKRSRVVNAYNKCVNAWKIADKYQFLEVDDYARYLDGENGMQLIWTAKGAEWVCNLIKGGDSVNGRNTATI